MLNALIGKTIQDYKRNFNEQFPDGNLDLSTIGSSLNKATGVEASNEFNAIEAQKQRDWEERMSNTQYQRTVSDMQAAGLNPAALYSGAGLTTLGSSQAATSSGNSSGAFGSILNAITGLVRAVKGPGRHDSYVNKTFNYYGKKR